MPSEIVMPRLSDTMSEGTVAKWRKQPGETVDKGDILVEIETDKATMELESFTSGVMGRILIPEGQTVPIGVPIALVLAQGEAPPPEPAVAAPTIAAEGVPAASDASTATPASSAPSPPVEATSVAAEDAPAASGSSTATPASSAPEPALAVPPSAEGKIRTSPLARRLAEERGVDLASVTGTGPDGRITKEDVEAAIQRAGAAPAPAAAPVSPPGLAEEEELVQLSTLQRTIVRRMIESKAASPHFYVTSEIDMADAVAFRRSLNATVEEGQGVTFNDIIVKSAALALRKFPDVNASYRDGQLVRHKGSHIGFAVAIPNGLVVPVLRDADQKPLLQIGREARELVEKARNRRLTLQEMEGSTFSVTNLGMYGIDQFTGIINQPNAGILAIGAIVRKPVVKDDQIVISDRMRITLSVDHRVFYGATAAEFLQEVRNILEHPLWLVL